MRELTQLDTAAQPEPATPDHGPDAGPAASPRSASAALTWGRATVDPALRAAIAELPGGVRRVIDFHFGWCDEHGNPVSLDNGKAIRPTLALLTAEAATGAWEPALPAAVAVELVHNFSLLHDDVMDGDVMRRHRPTAWAVFGIGPAILAGDALLALAFDVLAAAGGERATQAVRALSATVQDLVDGQAADLAFETRRDVALDECMDMARAKTSALLGCACSLGELSATGDPGRVTSMRSFGERLGLAFQLVDDILGIWGDPARTGKAIHSDISARKKSLPVVAALTSATPAANDLAALYFSSEPLADEDVAAAAALVASAGGRAWAEAEAARQLAGALEDLRAANPGALEDLRAANPSAGRAAAELESIAMLVTSRDR